MLSPKSLSLQNFKCFSGSLEFVYPTDAGLYFVTGRNELDPELEANACGKSTLFCDAPCWCLYGKTPRGLRASDVISWTASTSKVKFEFWLNDQLFQVVRSQHPNSLQVSVDSSPLTTITQEDLDKKLGLDYFAFCNSVVFSQLTTLFFDLKPAEKSEMLESVLPLSVWEGAVKKTKSQIDSLTNDLNAESQRVAAIRGKLTAVKELSESSDDKILEWEEERNAEINEISESFAEDDANLEKLKAEATGIVRKREQLKVTLDDAVELVNEAQQGYVNIQQEITKLDTQSGGLSSEAGAITQELRRLSNLGPTCSVCKQKIDEKHLETEYSRMNGRLAAIKLTLSDLKSEYFQKKGELSEAADASREAKQYTDSLKRDMDALTSKISSIQTSVARVLEGKKQKQSRIQSLQAKINPFIAQKEKLLAERRKLTALAMESKKKIVGLSEELTCTQFWLSGFKEVKLMLISDILTQLELEVNNYLFQFGLRDWKVEFGVDSVTKSGKQRKGFTVTIKAPGIEEMVAWSAWSGGETQRLRLAGALGMADLILSCFGLTPGLEVYDEPSTYLSAQGVSDLIASLRDRALDTHRIIFFIDHKNLDTSHFNGMYTVVKQKDVVQVESNV